MKYWTYSYDVTTLHPEPRDFIRFVNRLTGHVIDCKESYVSETKQSHRARVNQHRRPSLSESQNSVVYTHIKNSGHIFNPEGVVWTKKNVGLKEVCERQFGSEWSNHHSTWKGDNIFSCHMRGTGYWRTSLAVYHMTSQPVHKPDEVQRFWTQRRNVSTVSPVFDVISIYLKEILYWTK